MADVPGSGISPPPELLLLELLLAAAQPVGSMVLVSIVTASLRARALPQTILAPVFRVILLRARMLPRNDVVVPSVAEVPTCQKDT